MNDSINIPAEARGSWGRSFYRHIAEIQYTYCMYIVLLTSYMYCWLRALESECYLDVDIWVHAVSDKWGTNHDKAPWYVDRESVDTLVGDTVVAGYQLNELVPMFISCAALLEFLNNRYLGRYECLEKKTD